MIPSAIVVTALSALSAGEFTITVTDNVRVTGGESAYVEPQIACQTAPSARCAVTATKFTDGQPKTPAIFTTTDGGASWRPTNLTVGPFDHAVDGWVAFSDAPNGYACFLVIPPGEKKTEILVLRSQDDGQSWRRASIIETNRSFDRPTIIARGRDVVVAAEH